MFPQIRMEQTFALLGYEITRPWMEMEQPQAELNMRQIPPRMEMHTTDPIVLIDQTEAFADAGSKKLSRLMEEYAAKGRQAVLEGIARITEEGLSLRAIENGTGGKVLKQIAKQRTAEPFPVSQVDFIPKYGSVKIEGVPGKLEIEWHIGGFEMDPVIHPPQMDFHRGKIDYYMERVNQLKIWVEPAVDTRL